MSTIRSIEELFGEYIELASEQERTRFLDTIGKLRESDPDVTIRCPHDWLTAKADR